ncbi:PIN domain-containing protein [Micromonospora sp. NPDC094482]|uniref:PIN domain-containing protein n=2 Tax=unclassified Micromonospora TaxID=2617518 RepID=UPI00331ED813
MGQAPMPIYTEVTTLVDQDLYSRHGYVPLEPFTLPDGSPTYPMWRAPGQRRPRHRSSTPPARPDQRGPALNDLPIRLILDTSAILAFTEGSTAVGEAIATVASEKALFGLPVMCLAEAARSVVDTDRLDLLVNHPAAAVLTVDPLQWKALAATHRAVGRLDTADALLAAAGNDCRILSDQPGQ